MSQIQPSFKKKSVLYWLDAHWCVADNTAGGNSQCPLLEEIKAIRHLNEESIIIIDDARYFIAPPPSPHEISHWPDLNSILEALYNLSKNHEIVIFNDIILFYPLALKNVIRSYAYHNSVNWLTVMDKARDYNKLLDQLIEKEKLINTLSEDLIEKEKVIKSLSEDLEDKGEIEADILALSDSLNERTKKINKLSKQLADKEKQIVFLSESLNILKKRLSSPIWGLITLFQHHFPGLWNFLYEKKQKLKFKKAEKKEDFRLDFFTPRLGKLFHYPPIKYEVPNKNINEKLKTKPLRISVVTPSFNQGVFLKKTVESVINQNYHNLEYIIQDSCSTDETGNVLKNINDERIKCFIENDKGQADAINKGFAKSQGEIMAWLNSDDVYLPGTFNYVINYFNNHPRVDAVYGNRILIDTEDMEIGRWVLPPHDKKVLYWADFIPQETLFWRREIWEKVGSKINDNLNFAIDWDLLLRFQEAGAKIVRLPRFLAAFRIHPSQKKN